MYLFCYGTRPELIKLSPLINKFKEKNISYITLFSGQHEYILEQFSDICEPPTIKFESIQTKNLDKLVSHILSNMILVYRKHEIHSIIVHGDTSTALACALSGFHNNKKIIHIEAGLRTYDKGNPFPEESNRVLISKLSDFHFCPTGKAVENLRREGITKNVYLVGNTIVDAYQKYDSDVTGNYYLVTIHRRENDKKLSLIVKQIQELSKKGYSFIFLIHPRYKDKFEGNENLVFHDPVNYSEMLKLIKECNGIISDSGGLQEESVCAGKKILICRKTTERPEVVENGYGRLVDCEIEKNISFLKEKNEVRETNIYGKGVCEKIINLILNK